MDDCPTLACLPARGPSARTEGQGRPGRCTAPQPWQRSRHRLTVSDQVGIASHVLNVRSKLRYGRQLTLLARAPRIRNLGHGEGQRLMVNVRGKTGTLAEKSKMLCCEMESQQLSVRNTVLTLSISERVTEKGKGLPDAGDPLFQHGAQRYIQRVDGQCDLRSSGQVCQQSSIGQC